MEKQLIKDVILSALKLEILNSINVINENIIVYLANGTQAKIKIV